MIDSDQVFRRPYKTHRAFLKISLLALLVNLGLFFDVQAMQKGHRDEDMLFEHLHNASASRNGHYLYESGAALRRNPVSEADTRIAAQVARMRVADPLPSLTLKQTPSTIIKQYSSEVPILESGNNDSFQLTSGNDFYQSAVGNQLQLGTCSSFAIVDALLFVHGKTLSPAYLNVRAKRQYALDCANNGLDIGVGMKCALEYGTVMDWVWPYQGYYAQVERANEKISNDPQPNWNVCIKSPYTDEQDKGLVKFAFGEVKSLFLTDKKDERALLIKDALLTYKSPIIVSVPVQWNDEWKPNTQKTGQIKTIFNLNAADGWHAISICGFDLRTKELIFKNSWGKTWGNNGFGRMSFNYLAALAREAWVGIGTNLKS